MNLPPAHLAGLVLIVKQTPSGGHSAENTAKQPKPEKYISNNVK